MIDFKVLYCSLWVVQDNINEEQMRSTKLVVNRMSAQSTRDFTVKLCVIRGVN